MLDLARRATPRVAIVLVATVAVVTSCIPLTSQEEVLFSRTNELRASQGVPVITYMDELVVRARELARGLAARGQLSHSDLKQMGIAWTAAAENVGRSHSIEDIYERLAASAPHRANMLNASYTRTGVGTARGKDGSVYAVQLFARPA